MSSTTDDRAAGAVLGMACGDALGAGARFGPPLGEDAPVAPVAITRAGGGDPGRAPGEWTGDTVMAVPILQAAAAGESLTDESTQDAIVAAWVGWARDAKGVGTQTRAVLGALREPTAAAARAASRALHDRTGRTAGDGALARTAPVALAFAQSGATSGLVRAATQLWR